MSIVVVILLAVLWAWILLPGAVREHREASPASSVSRFQRSMARLGRLGRIRRSSLPWSGRAGREVLMPARPAELRAERAAARAARRRRHVLTILTAVTTLSLIGARSLGGVLWVVFWLAAVLLVVFVGLLGHRWVQISRRDAQPLVMPRDALSMAADRRDAGADVGESGNRRDVLTGDGVRIIDW